MNIIDKLTTKGFKFPFDGSDWFSSFGIYCLINIAYGIIWFGVSLIAMFLWPFFLAILESTSGSYITILIISITLLMLIFGLISLYLGGYQLEMMKNLKDDKELQKPYHTQICYKLRLGLSRFLINAVVSIIMTIFFAASIILTIWGGTLTGSAPILGILIIIIGVIFTLFFVGVAIYFQAIGVPAMIYNYLSTGSLVNAFNTDRMVQITRYAWREFLIIYVVIFLGTIVLGMITAFPGVGYFIYMIALPYLTFIISFLTGNIYYNLQTNMET